VLGATINGGEQITIALRRAPPARNKDRLGDRVTRRQLIDRAFARLKIDMGERVEAIDKFAVAAGGEIAVANTDSFKREPIDDLAQGSVDTDLTCNSKHLDRKSTSRGHERDTDV
jgi:hypothetical protein